jgi:hypothetical protein
MLRVDKGFDSIAEASASSTALGYWWLHGDGQAASSAAAELYTSLVSDGQMSASGDGALLKVEKLLTGEAHAGADQTADLTKNFPIEGSADSAAQPASVLSLNKASLWGTANDNAAAFDTVSGLGFVKGYMLGEGHAASYSLVSGPPSIAGIVYRVIVRNTASQSADFDYPWTNRVADIDFGDESATDIKTASLTFEERSADIETNLTQATVEGNYSMSRWLALPHSGTDYFHFGKSAYKDDPTQPASQGDSLQVDMGSSSTYYWTITYLDATTTQGSETTQIITWDADDYGGTAIQNIVVRTGGHGGSEVASMVPTLFLGGDTAVADGYGKTWTLTRAYNTTYYYEPSGSIDRDVIKPAYGKGLAQYGTFRFDRHSPVSIVAYVRRFWDTSGTTDILNGIDSTSRGIRLFYDGDYVKGQVSDGTTTVEVTWNEAGLGRLGEWNLLVLRRNFPEEQVQLSVNGILEDTAPDTTMESLAFPYHPTTMDVFEDTYAKTFDFSFISFFERVVSDDEVDAMILDLS